MELKLRLNRSLDDVGKEMHELIAELFPFCRSISGDGVRDTLAILSRRIPLEIRKIPTGTQAFDWVIPKEWNIRDAYIKDGSGRRVVDFRSNNLHVVSYSTPINRRVSLQELKEHAFTLPEHPDWIPYRTSYYAENWGFCLSHNQLQSMRDDEYEVLIDASLENGHLTYGEYHIQGQSAEEVLISTHICHPSLANDNLSGVALALFLAKELSICSPRLSYRFLFIPATIGSIAWLSANEHHIPTIRHGLVLACVGDAGKCSYKRSRAGEAEIDRAVSHVLRHSKEPHEILNFSPYGYDERQFCSPGINLPVGCFMRTPHGEFPEYHTSADNLEFVRPTSLADSFSKCLSVFWILEHNKTYRNLNPKCEPQLGKRGLYSNTGGQTDRKLRELAMLWVLNLSDGVHDLLDIAERSRLSFASVKEAADALMSHDLLNELR
jgi:aminopeptidase-like protein